MSAILFSLHLRLHKMSALLYLFGAVALQALIGTQELKRRLPALLPLSGGRSKYCLSMQKDRTRRVAERGRQKGYAQEIRCTIQVRSLHSSATFIGRS
ncbi:MAG: hypothetical protein ABIE47_04840 [Pseudomonadota bacterium]